MVKSAEAFTEAARDDARSVGIQVGFYELKHKMSAKSALAVLLKPSNRMRSVVTVPEGLRVDQIVDLLAKRTKFTRKQFDRVLAHPKQLGLPSYAQGNPEGYLFPATYELAPNATPRSILAAMVQRYDAAVSDLRHPGQGQGAGLHPARRDDGGEHRAGGGQAAQRLPQDRPGPLQPARQGPAAAARHHDRLHLPDPGEADDLGGSSGPRTRRTTPTSTPACRPHRSPRPGRRPSRRRCRRRTGPGCTSSPPTRATAR